MPTCVACDTDLLPGRPFCGGCGTRVIDSQQPVPVPTPPAAPVCRCGAVLTGAFCGECGTPRPQVAPTADSIADPVAAPSGAVPTWTPHPPAAPSGRGRRWPLVAGVATALLLTGAALLGGLGLVEALILLVLVVIAISLGAGLSGSRDDTSSGPLLTDPALGDRDLVYSRFGVEHGPVTAAELGRIATLERLPPTTQVRDTEGGAWFPLSELVRTTSRKSFGTALALTFFLGAMGAHWFYLGRPGLGLLRLVTWAATMTGAVVALVQASSTSYDQFTGVYSSDLSPELLGVVWIACGVIGMWTLLDLILVATRSVRDGEGRRLE